ncbi:MAG: hypothetical protein IKZ92_06710 [Muribaculaceae bacterium]|nr:hypothetical protein [Muribaculaceae bacterium]
MKNQSSIKVAVLAIIAVVACVTLEARTVTVNISSIPKNANIASALNNKFKGLTYDDTAVINFDRSGTYTIDEVVSLKCNVVVSGTGADNTILILNKDDNKPLKGADAFLSFTGKLGRPITVSLSDLSIKLKEHKGIWWENSAFHAVKIYHADRIDIRNVNSYMSNAIITNFDLRVCSNVTVENCILSNYNNCNASGILWLRGDMHNINIHHNKIYKYGNDEAVAFFGTTVDANKNMKGNISRTNIRVTDNEFYYKHNDKVIDDLYMSMYLSVLTAETDRSQYTSNTQGFEVARNRFEADDLCKRFVYFQFCVDDQHSDISVHDNEFVSNPVESNGKFYRMDIDVWDSSTQQDTIVVRDNTMTNYYPLMNPYSGTGYTFLLVRGGNVVLDGNKINNHVTTGPDGKPYGINLLWSGQEGGSVTLRNNVCKGLARIITLESGKGIGHFSLNANNNYFQGRTSIYCAKIDRLDLDFRNNTFESNHNYFFLQDFANKGTVVFNNNKVTVSSGYGRLMGHWGNGNTYSMKFDRLEVKGNEFHGVKNQSELLKDITNVRKRTVKSNTYYQK